MKHGTQCDCIMCAVGKKMGMIASKKKTDYGHDQGENVKETDANKLPEKE